MLRYPDALPYRRQLLAERCHAAHLPAVNAIAAS